MQKFLSINSERRKSDYRESVKTAITVYRRVKARSDTSRALGNGVAERACHRYRLHRLTLPHGFWTSCSNEIKRPFCTRRRVTYATLCARRRRGERAGTGQIERRSRDWKGETEEETETRELHREQQNESESTDKNTERERESKRTKEKKRQKKEGETAHIPSKQSAHHDRKIVHKAYNEWDKQKCAFQQRNLPKLLRSDLSLIYRDFLLPKFQKSLCSK